MSTDAIASTTTSGTTTQSTLARNKLADDMDTFLTLLTTQLANQDPLSPMDSTEFTNQLVQFALVEQNIDQNANLEDLLGMTANNQAALAVSYLDKYVEAQSETVSLQDGQAVFTYGLSGEAKTVTVAVYDQAGDLVRTFVGDPSAGLHKVTWDGTDNYGLPVDDGAYTLSVTATSSTGDEVETWTTTLGKVTGVATDGEGGTLLSLNNYTTVDLLDVLGTFQTLPSDYQLATTGSGGTTDDETTTTGSDTGETGDSETDDGTTDTAADTTTDDGTADDGTADDGTADDGATT